jgi:para-nitrobenzyl esterase
MASLKTAEEAGVKFAAAHHSASIKELRAIPAAELLPGPQGAPLRFGPDIDGWVLPDSPAALSGLGADNDVPVITGYQANDGLLFSPRLESLDQFTQMVKTQYGEMSSEFEHLYPAKNVDEAKSALAESIRDRDRVSMYLWASRRSKNHHQPVFTYFFDHAIPWPQHPEFGAFHSGELPYFFLNLRQLDRPYQKVDFDLANTSAAYLKNFAAQGDPNGGSLPKWPRVDSTTPATMELGERLGPMPLADNERLDFWIRFFDSPAGSHAPPF